jgi:hypothetical protein
VRIHPVDIAAVIGNGEQPPDGCQLNDDTNLSNTFEASNSPVMRCREMNDSAAMNA